MRSVVTSVRSLPPFPDGAWKSLSLSGVCGAFYTQQGIKILAAGWLYDRQRRFYRVNAFREMIGPYASGGDVRPYGSLKHVELSELSALRR